MRKRVVPTMNMKIMLCLKDAVKGLGVAQWSTKGPAIHPWKKEGGRRKEGRRGEGRRKWEGEGRQTARSKYL